MKYLCDACSRLVTVGSFSVREESLVLVCPACGAESHAGPEEAREAPVLTLAKPKPPPEGPLCPKCGASRPAEHDSCARCGLVFALFKPETLALPDEVEQIWKRLEANWSDEAEHEAFVEVCARAEGLQEAARRYRLKAEQDPRDRIAERFRDRLVSRLMAMSTVPVREPRAETGSRVHPVVVAALVAAFGALFFSLVWMMLSRQSAAPWP
jgi:hypothetical protein